jgi:hypothetical protein
MIAAQRMTHYAPRRHMLRLSINDASNTQCVFGLIIKAQCAAYVKHDFALAMQSDNTQNTMKTTN